MDAYQRLTEDLPARLPPGRSQRASEKATRDAVAGLPLANPAQALHEVQQILDGMLATSWSGGERLAALPHLRGPVEGLCRAVEQQLGADSHPLPAASAERAVAAQQLEWQLACGYAIGLHEMCAPAGKLPMFKGKLAAAAIVAGLVHASRVLTWAYRQYRTPPAGVWRLVHALYAFAGELGLADQPVEDAFTGGGPLSARSAYAQTLLLAISDPYRFSARELKDAGVVIRCVGGQCGLARAGGTPGVRVDTDADAGPGYVAEEQIAAGAGMLVLDVQPVVRIFDERIALLPKGSEMLDLPRPGGGAATVQVALLRRLQASWATAVRGHARLPASHALDLMVGMHAVHYALAGNLDFGTFIRQVQGEAITVGRHELASAWMASSDTARPQMLRGEVLDQSEGGYRLRLQVSDGVRLRIGEIVGLAPAADEEEERDWMVGIIRWLRMEGDHESLGIELLHRTARAAGVRPMTAGGEALVPQRAVELPGYAEQDGLALLVTNRFPGNAATAEVVLPALASDWHAGAAVGVWRCDGAEVIGNACVRVDLVRDDAARAAGTEVTP
ncbi:MAG: hypothetical protein OJF61_000789 [Rhodanobacteraceae bacterium]|jgi:hypothetical protein|nr:MAG: hypothetical protein OJF61_000789 [Rhodanobacteraceae bacterium]